MWALIQQQNDSGVVTVLYLDLQVLLTAYYLSLLQVRLVGRITSKMKQKLDKLAALQKYTTDQATLTQQGH